ncbi:hypothetical protein [Paraflavitalea sp. CAU 1676]|uniref:hypothetical protein n=1 Tax=Paraflavitalea sp. CAU 1676 TaxID=3032598 RepID=UPI0023DB27CE|nr:hypothetical protein [Paraflavitalea sp. CAU 1676]MDF2190237.1 hypothetical protein [Paraflavitalea sp. CAU 1676]
MKINLTTIALAMLLVATACSSAKKTQIESAGGSSYPKLPGSRDYAMLDDKSFKLTAITDDSTYGYTVKSPIMVGGGLMNGAANEQRYLNGLQGPNGETISYHRLGSCCPFKTKNGLLGDGGLLDKYEVTWEGQDKPVILFINMYDAGDLKAPKGFTFRQ